MPTGRTPRSRQTLADRVPETPHLGRRRIYQLTPMGAAALVEGRSRWEQFVSALQSVLAPIGPETDMTVDRGDVSPIEQFPDQLLVASSHAPPIALRQPMDKGGSAKIAI